MDYTNFVKTYYRTVVSKLNKFSSYNGTFANLNYGLNISPEFLHKTVSNLDILPNFELNIDAPLSEYEKFFSYYSAVYPELIMVLPSVNNLFVMYNMALSKGNLVDEQKATEYIDLIIDMSLEILMKSGVIK